MRLWDGGMELRDKNGALFTNVVMVHNVCPLKLDVIRLTPV